MCVCLPVCVCVCLSIAPVLSFPLVKRIRFSSHSLYDMHLHTHTRTHTHTRAVDVCLFESSASPLVVLLREWTGSLMAARVFSDSLGFLQPSFNKSKPVSDSFFFPRPSSASPCPSSLNCPPSFLPSSGWHGGKQRWRTGRRSRV